MEFYHNSQSQDWRAPLGAVPCGTEVDLRISIHGEPAQVWLRGWQGNESLIEMNVIAPGIFQARVTMPQVPVLWWYYFIIRDSAGVTRYWGNAGDNLGGEGAVYDDPPPSYQITVYDPAFMPPRFLREGAMYQIFPDRFAKSNARETTRTDIAVHQSWKEDPVIDTDPRSGDNRALDFFGGNLLGITDHLPYLASLGITILYLNPIFKARSNHRYDTGDYDKVDPLLGNEQDLSTLCGNAEALGIRVILDGVFSHTGEDSRYFNRYGTYDSIGAYQSRDSRYYNWYKFRKYPDDYACWWGIPTLPELEKNEPAYRDFICGDQGIARKWLRNGTCGWRLDVADELPMVFLRNFRRAVKSENPEAAVIGEVWEDASHKVSYGEMRSYCLGDTLDSVMNYPLRDAVIAFLTGNCDAYGLVRLIKSQQENYPVPFFYAMMNLTGSHDRARILNVLSGQEYLDIPWSERGKARLSTEMRALAVARYSRMLMLYMALPGFPCIYYGDETGMEGAADPFCRRPYPWDQRDEEIEQLVRTALLTRRSRPVLRTGALDITAKDKHTVAIRRYLLSGTDMFGEMITDDEYCISIVNT
jgi:cyclomaltodextrinase / maltogenic alpha-amylase / neopullulanase